jgi:hypothetical protein
MRAPSFGAPASCVSPDQRHPVERLPADHFLLPLIRQTAPDLLKAGIIDEIVPEPIGGAHTDPTAAAASVDEALARSLAEVTAMTSELRLDTRYEKFRNMGRLGIDFVEG